MKATGIVRRIDELGRVVLPVELRRSLGIGHTDILEILVDYNEVILKKYTPKCIFCGGDDSIVAKMGKHVCKKCIQEIG